MQTLFTLLDGSHDMVVDKEAQEVIDNKNMLVFNLAEQSMVFFVEKVVIMDQPVVFCNHYFWSKFSEA